MRLSRPIAIHLPPRNFQISARKFWLNGLRPWILDLATNWRMVGGTKVKFFLNRFEFDATCLNINRALNNIFIKAAFFGGLLWCIGHSLQRKS